MRLVPVGMTKDELLDVLDDIRGRVAAGDSFEGSLSYEMPRSMFDEIKLRYAIREAWPHRHTPGVRLSLRSLLKSMRQMRESRKDFDVRASYRIGNSMGQGGVSMVGEWKGVEPDA